MQHAANCYNHELEKWTLHYYKNKHIAHLGSSFSMEQARVSSQWKLPLCVPMVTRLWAPLVLIGDSLWQNLMERR